MASVKSKVSLEPRRRKIAVRLNKEYEGLLNKTGDLATAGTNIIDVFNIICLSHY